MTKTVMFISWAPGDGYSITQGEPPVDLLKIAEARLARAEAAVYQKHLALSPPDVCQRLLAERRAARRDVQVLNSIGALLESLCGP